MASYETPVLDISLEAGENLSAKQFYFVKMSADNTVVCCAAATDIPIGVLQNKPTSGDHATVRVLGVSLVAADAALTVPALIGTSADGQADAKTSGADTTEYAVGQLLVGTSAGGTTVAYGTATINCMNPHRGA
jgi:hypothetical protein